MNKELKDKVFLITYGILLFLIALNYNFFFNILGKILKVSTPFLIGLVIAYILNILVNTLEKRLLKKLKKSKRIISITLSLIFIFGFIIILSYILVPQIKNAGEIFVNNIPTYQETINKYGRKIGLSEDKLNILGVENNKLGTNITNIIKNNSDSIINASLGFASSLFSGLYNVIIGLVFAIYILLDKEHLTKQFKKILKVTLKENHYNKLVEILSLSNTTFTNYVKVMVVDASIVGLLCLMGMIIFDLPYAATISVLVGFTALIPIFGSYMGCLIGAFLIFMVSPIKALTYILYFIAFQQVEGNFIYPRIVSGRIGLPSIWVLVAVTIGGGLGGVVGMLIGVPIASIIYSLIKVNINKKSSN